MTRETTLVIVTTLALVGIGVLMVFSATAVDGDGLGLLKRQAVFAVLGIAALVIAARFDYHRLRDPFLFKCIVLGSILLLGLVLVPGIGVKVDGAQRWIRILGFQFQPSEMAKVALILLLAAVLTDNQANRNHLIKGFFPPVFIGGLFATLVYLERDLGVPVVLLVVTLGMMWAAGIHWVYIGSTAAGGAALAAFLAISTPHRMQRLLAFWDPWAHRDDASFQLVQSLRAFAEGGLQGAGLGAGQQKLYYLFAAHTDFIYAVIGEEAGLVGTLFVLFLFGLLCWASLRIAAYANDTFGSLLATGIAVLIMFQAAFIMAVTVGLLPTKGIPLPFVSYGGSSLIIFMALVGILVSIGAQAGNSETPRRAFLPK
jgi:cell division protein FtsW